MPTVAEAELNTSLTPKMRGLIKTILDAAAELKQLMPDEEFEHGFEFHWGHSNSSRVKPMPDFKPRTRSKNGDTLDEPIEGELVRCETGGLSDIPDFSRHQLNLPCSSPEIPALF